ALKDTGSVGSSEKTLKRMGDMVQQMVNDALNAFVGKDVAMAEELIIRDEEVDHMHNTLFRELLTYMMEDPRYITTCMHLLFIAKNIERMGDHTTAVAEQIHYVVTGQVPEDDRPKSDITSQMIVDADTNGS
ncbi:MAG: phosphate uptake regulator PhoU, partial [Rhizobiaceae bacterium]